MNIIECPHCYRRVAIGENGVCPSCRANTRDVSGVDLDRTRMKIKQSTALPDICFECAKPAELSIRIRPSQYGGPGKSEAEQIALLTLVSFLFGVLPWANRSNRDRLNIDIPACSNCVSKVDERIANIDIANGHVVLQVHKEFKRRAAPIQ